MKTVLEMNVAELAAYVCSHLDRCGIRVVLSGGSVVSIYADGLYVSMDLDFINQLHTTRNQLKDALGELGFSEKDRYFVHPDTEYFIEFPAGPLAVGNEPVRQIEELELSTGKLRLISPTDCVKDRLSAFFHWGDQQCFQQAIWVANLKEIDWSEVERWSDQEGEPEKFKLFRKAAEERSV